MRAIGTVVNITGLASDADATTNTITYSLQNNDGGRFTIDANSGVVTVAGAINREADGAAETLPSELPRLTVRLPIKSFQSPSSTPMNSRLRPRQIRTVRPMRLMRTWPSGRLLDHGIIQ